MATELILTCVHWDEPVRLASGRGALLGRDPKADIVLDVSGVSKQHCELYCSARGATISDLGSTNGTYVNGRYVSEAKLGDGDIIDLGPNAQLTVTLAGDAGPPPCGACGKPLTALEASDGGRYKDGRGVYCEACAVAGAGQFTRLASYRLLRALGQGMTGRVYEAIDTRDGSRWALKLLNPGMLASTDTRDQRAVQRFLREISVMETLDHPNIVGFHDAGEVAGQAYLAMELIDGADLGARLKQRGQPFSAAELVPILDAAAAALAHAHARSVIHRDIKPGNILHSDDGAIRLTDFGLARREDSESLLTGAGAIVGTLEFMAPEQIESAVEADARADVYGLAATALYLLTGRRPFEASSDYQLMMMVTTGSAPRLRELLPDAPAALDALLAEAMTRDRDQRLACATQLATRWREAVGREE